MKITEGVYQVGGSGFSHPSDAGVYLVINGESALMVDAGTGCGTDRIMAAAASAGVYSRGIEYLFLTHCHYDHAGGAEAVRKETGCRIVCHELDAVYLETGDPMVTAADWYRAAMPPFSIDIKAAGPSALFTIGGKDISFIHTPGHSPGSAVLLWEAPGARVLFGQDVHGPLNDTLLSNRDDYRKSLMKMISFEADILCEGHFGVIEGRESVRRFIESYL